MTVRVFVDTNILVYARDASEPRKQPRAAAWMQHLWDNRPGRLSYQVLQEFYVTVTGRLSPGLAPGLAAAEVRALFAWRPVATGQRIFESAWRVQHRFHLSWWDALIVAAASESGCRYLLTDDLTNGQSLDDVQVVDPFSTPPDAIE